MELLLYFIPQHKDMALANQKTSAKTVTNVSLCKGNKG
jgi:hypothetical protein